MAQYQLLHGVPCVKVHFAPSDGGGAFKITTRHNATLCKHLQTVMQTFAPPYADQRIGEILRELPTKQGKRTDTSSTAIEEVTKAEAKVQRSVRRLKQGARI